MSLVKLFSSRRFASAALAVACLGLGLSLPTSARAAVGGIANDAGNTAWYPNESGLTPSAVASGNFGEIFDDQLSGEIYAQPLVYKGVVIVATEADMVYGIKASTGQILW
jgi:outer membrane protein assembly factor BamB